MRHLGTQTLETNRLILRRFTIEDAPAMYRNWASDPEVTKYLTWPTYTDPAMADAILSDWSESYSRDNFYQWAIELKELKEPIGSISVVSHNDALQIAHIGYCLGRAWWHKGIMSETLQAVIDYLFDQVGMRRIESLHDPNNPHSGSVMRKCGMHYEGTHRQSDRNNQGICDAAWYAILASDRKSKQ